MTTFIKENLKESDDQMNIDKYRVAANVAEYQIISKLFHVKNACKKVDINMFKMGLRTF